MNLRRHLNTAQKAELALRLVPIERELAWRRELSGKSADGSAGGRGRNKNHPPNSEEGFGQGEARVLAALRVGIGKDTLWKVEQIKAAILP